MNWIGSRHPQRETEAGLEAASRWLGVREELASNECFRTYATSDGAALEPVTDPTLRLRAFGEENDDRDTRYFGAVDDGSRGSSSRKRVERRSTSASVRGRS